MHSCHVSCSIVFIWLLFHNFISSCKDRFKMISDEDKRILSGPITKGELDCAMKGIRSEACAGPDGVSGRLMRMVYSLCPRLFLKAVNDEILKGKCAGKILMSRNLICIPKNNDEITIKAFRPISLINSTLKVADACIVQRLNIGLQNANVLPS